MWIRPIALFFDQFRGRKPGGLPLSDPKVATHMAAALDSGDPVVDEGGDPAALAADYFDGVLDETEQSRFETRLARVPGELADLESTRGFLDAVARSRAVVPADLLEPLLEAEPARRPVPVRARFAGGRGALRWAAVAACTLLLGVPLVLQPRMRGRADNAKVLHVATIGETVPVHPIEPALRDPAAPGIRVHPARRLTAPSRHAPFESAIRQAYRHAGALRHTRGIAENFRAPEALSNFDAPAVGYFPIDTCPAPAAVTNLADAAQKAAPAAAGAPPNCSPGLPVFNLSNSTLQFDGPAPGDIVPADTAPGPTSQAPQPDAPDRPR